MLCVTFDLSSTNAFNLGRPKILSSVKGLKVENNVGKEENAGITAFSSFLTLFSKVLSSLRSVKSTRLGRG